LIGFLIGLPGQAPAKDLPTAGQLQSNPVEASMKYLAASVADTAASAQRHRISVFSDWLVGGAFALLLANGGKIMAAIGDASRWAVADDDASIVSMAERLQQAAIISFAVCFFATAFIVAWWQTATNGAAMLSKIPSKRP
jgi:hypothetical protein